MNSALKPVLPGSGSQNPASVPNQIPNKPLHLQGTPTNITYGQNNTVASSIVNLPHSNNIIQANHQQQTNHPNPAHQNINHFSLNPLNASTPHYSTNQSTILATQPNQIPAIGPNYSPNKNAVFAGGYQPNLGHPPNLNPLPPVSQSLPSTQAAATETPPADKLQSNGTSEVKTPPKVETSTNYVNPSPTKDDASSSKHDKTQDAVLNINNTATTLPKVPDQLKSDTVKAPEESKVSLPTTEPTPPAKNTKSDLPTNTERVSESAQVSNTDGDGAKKAALVLSNKDGKDDEESSSEEEEEEEEEEDDEDDEIESPVHSKTKERESKVKATPVEKAAMTPTTLMGRTPPARKSKTPKTDSESPKSSKSESKASTIQKSPGFSTKVKRTRVRTQPYQSPLPEIEIITKITKIASTTPKTKATDDKLIVFYKNEFLAVRNSEGSFYVCQAVQNIYKSSPKIKIRWLSQDKNEKSGQIYTPDFYDFTDFDCILTNLELNRVDKGKYRLPPAEKERTDSILKRSIAVEKGEASPSLTEEHPDGIDVSLYKEESQLTKKGRKRKASKTPKDKSSTEEEMSPEASKTRKVAARAGRKGAKKTPGRKPAAAAVADTTSSPSSSSDARKSNVLSRTDRAKRRSDNHNKLSPVVDQKKAKVLAKVARKVAPKSPAKNAKVVKESPSSSKVQKTQPKAATRKTKRTTRK